jgi:HEAT repeat protein
VSENRAVHIGTVTVAMVWCLVFLVVCAAVAVPVWTLSHEREFTPTLQNANPAVRVAAIRASGREGHLDLLMKALQDEDADVRLVAAMYLMKRGTAAAPCAKTLWTVRLYDNHAGVRSEAAKALHEIGAAAAPILIEALTDPDPSVRARAAGALRVVAFKKWNGRPSADELAKTSAALEKALQDEDAEVRENAATSLTYIRRAEAGETLYEGK